MYKKPYITLEVGCNHKGKMDIAKKMIHIASEYCNADAIKFQKRCNKELLTKAQYDAPHPNPRNSYGKTYGEHREYLEFTVEQHILLKEWCEECGITYSTSVWDMTSAKEIAGLKPEFIKVPSASNNNYEMLQWLCDNYQGEIQISIGMSTYKEEQEIVDLFVANGRNKDLVLFSCTSGYPIALEDICLLEIRRLHEVYGNVVKRIGFSGHHLGILPDTAAYTLGAEVIERHFTLDKTWKGTDHSASLEPEEAKNLVKSLNDLQKALTYKGTDILPVEQVQREKLKYKKFC